LGPTGPTGPTGPPGPIAGSNTQVIYNSGGSAAGSANLTFNGTTLFANQAKFTNRIGIGNGVEPYLNTGSAGIWLSQSANSSDIFMGAQSASIFGVYLGDWRFTVSSGGTASATNDFRAPIFYDSNNTGYYVDPNASTSANFYGSVNAATYNLAGLLVNASGTSSSGGAIAIQQVTGEGWTGIFCDFEPYTGWGLWHDNPNNYFSFTSESSTGSIRSFSVPSRSSGLRTAYEKFRVDQGSGDTITGGIAYANASSRAPIFYDSNNTGYYLDPASTSELNKIYYNSNMVSRNYGIGQVGLYDSYKYQAVFSMGESYILPADGSSTGNLYGIAWSYPNAGGAASNLASHGMLILLNGGFYGAWGGASLRNPGDIRGTIYYDWDNTGYYVDPASTSNLNYAAFSRAAAGYDAGVTGAFSCNNWFRTSGANGLYLASYAFHWYNVQDTYGTFDILGYQNSYAGIRLANCNRTTWMHDTGGNGGLYNYSYWIFYWLVGNACLGVRTSTTSSSYALYVDGGIYSTGNVVAYSDVRKKTNIVTVDNALDTVAKLRGVYYNRIETNDEKVDPNKRQIGVIAQEINEVLPEVVTYAKDVDEYGVQYGNMAGLFIEAIKELKAEIEELKRKLH
jgi:hypothetical protein